MRSRLTQYVGAKLSTRTTSAPDSVVNRYLSNITVEELLEFATQEKLQSTGAEWWKDHSLLSSQDESIPEYQDSFYDYRYN